MTTAPDAMSDFELAGMQDRADAATAGPWFVRQFIAHARQDIPRLIGEVRRLRILLADKTARSQGPQAPTGALADDGR